MKFLDYAFLDIETHHLPIPKKSRVSPVRGLEILICLVILILGFVIGMGMDRELFASQVKLVTYCSHGTCNQYYVEPCSSQDWNYPYGGQP